MKPKCFLARIVMAGMCPGDRARGWVSRHVERCQTCRAEAEALEATTLLLREQAGVQDCPIEWARVRAALGEPQPVRRPVWRLAGAAACGALLIAAGLLWMLAGPETKRPSTEPREGMVLVEPAPERPGPERTKVVQKPEPTPQAREMTRPEPPEQSAPGKQVKRWKPRYHKKALPPHSVIVKRGKPSEPPQKAPDLPTVLAVAPVEHVIDIVGVNVDQGEDHSYVIRQVSADLDGQAQGVRL